MVGHETGIFDNWEDCKLQVENFPGARYKSFDSQTEAVEAYRGNPDDYLKVFRAMAARDTQIVNYAAIPEIVPGSVAVDAACSGNPGRWSISVWTSIPGRVYSMLTA